MMSAGIGTVPDYPHYRRDLGIDSPINCDCVLQKGELQSFSRNDRSDAKMSPWSENETDGDRGLAIR